MVPSFSIASCSQESLKGPWPQVSFSSELKSSSCALHILQLCRHHLLDLGPSHQDGWNSLHRPSFSTVLIPGPFVCIQYVLAVANNALELYDCHMEASGRRLTFFKDGVCYFIEAQVEPCRTTSIVAASKVDCGNNSLPSYAGKLTCLYAADSPSEYHIKVKLVSLGGSFDCCVQHGVENVLDEIEMHIVTHYAPKNLFDFCDGHSLPHLGVEYPLAKLRPVGILGKPIGQKILRHFQGLVENGAHHCFKQDQFCFLETLRFMEENIQDLILAVQLEETVLLYQMGNLEECKRLGQNVCIQANRCNSPNYRFIAGKAKYLLSGVYKQEQNFEKAQEHVDAATELLESVVPGEDTANNLTCIAALYSEKAAVVGISQSEKNAMDMACKDVMWHYGHQLDQNAQRSARAPRRSLNRRIFYYLHASRSRATDMQVAVSTEELRVVETLIGQFRQNFLNDCPFRDKALFLCAQADVMARKGQFEHGITIVSEALKIAKRLELPDEIQGARDRLQLLTLLSCQNEQDGAQRRPQEISDDNINSAQRLHEARLDMLDGHLDELINTIRTPV